MKIAIFIGTIWGLPLLTLLIISYMGGSNITLYEIQGSLALVLLALNELDGK